MTTYNPRADFKDEFDGLKLEQIHEQVKDLTLHTHFTHNGSALVQWSSERQTKASRASEWKQQYVDDLIFSFERKKKSTIVLLIFKHFLQSSFFKRFISVASSTSAPIKSSRYSFQTRIIYTVYSSNWLDGLAALLFSSPVNWWTPDCFDR